MKKLLKRAITVIAVIATAVGGVVVVGSPASAALPYCNNVSGLSDDSFGRSRYQTYRNSSGAYSIGCDMNYLNESGTAGQRRAIKQLQWDLKFCYNQNISYDGEYGPGTKQAVKNVQTYLNTAAGGSHGLTVDGWAGPNTRKAMRHVAVEETFCAGVSAPAFDVFTIYYMDVPTSV